MLSQKRLASNLHTASCGVLCFRQTILSVPAEARATRDRQPSSLPRLCGATLDSSPIAAVQRVAEPRWPPTFAADVATDNRPLFLANVAAVRVPF